MLEAVGVGEPERPRRREVALFRPVRPFLDRHLLDQFGDQEVGVRITLPVTVRTHVERHSVEPDREIRPMIEVHAA